MLCSSINTSTPPRTVIIGIGNWLLGDEGVGIHLISALSEHLAGYANVTIVDGGTSPDAMLLLDDVDRLIVLDAVNGGREPGTVYRFAGEDIEHLKSSGVSLHEWSAADSLMAISLIGKLPHETVVIGIEPELVGWGTSLSDTVGNKLPEVIGLVLNEIQANKLAGRN
ncbi:MAG: hydrogenase maturation protease [Chloroflexota bacterium]